MIKKLFILTVCSVSMYAGIHAEVVTEVTTTTTTTKKTITNETESSSTTPATSTTTSKTATTGAANPGQAYFASAQTFSPGDTEPEGSSYAQ